MALMFFDFSWIPTNYQSILDLVDDFIHLSRTLQSNKQNYFFLYISLFLDKFIVKTKNLNI